MKDLVSRQRTYNSNIVYIIYILTILVFLFFNSSLFTESSAIIFNVALILFVQILIFILFRADLISCVTFLTTITLWPSMVYSYFTPTKELGDLYLGIIPVYMYEDTFYVFIFIVALSFSAYVFKLNIFWQRVKNSNFIEVSPLMMNVNSVIAISASIIAFPSLPKISGGVIAESSFNGLLPGHAWNQLAIVALLFNLKYIFKHKSVLLTYLFVIIWFILHGERADISGLFLLLIILIYSSKHIKLRIKMLSTLIAFMVIVFFIKIKTGFSILTCINDIFTFSTISDTSYELNDGVNYVYEFGLTHGKIFKSVLNSVIPLRSSIHDSLGYFLLKENNYYPGGSSIIDTPLMDWGPMGIVLSPILYSLLVKGVTKVAFPIAKYEILILICLAPRIAWYGINNVFTSVIFFVPFMYILDKKVLK